MIYANGCFLINESIERCYFDDMSVDLSIANQRQTCDGMTLVAWLDVQTFQRIGVVVDSLLQSNLLQSFRLNHTVMAIPPSRVIAKVMNPAVGPICTKE